MNELIESHIGFAHAIAADLAGKYPPHITRADLEGAAEFGLVQAAQNYDPSKSVSFATFAYYRVRGAIFDEVRKSWNASHVKVIADRPATKEFADPTCAEDEAGLRHELGECAPSGTDTGFVSLDRTHPDQIQATTESPATHVFRKEESEAIRKAMRQLPQRHRFVLHAYYFEDHSLVSIGKQLNLSKSWVSRIHSQALVKLRTILQQSLKPSSVYPPYGGAPIAASATLC